MSSVWIGSILKTTGHDMFFFPWRHQVQFIWIQSQKYHHAATNIHLNTGCTFLPSVFYDAQEYRWNQNTLFFVENKNNFTYYVKPPVCLHVISKSVKWLLFNNFMSGFNLSDQNLSCGKEINTKYSHQLWSWFLQFLTPYCSSFDCWFELQQNK